MVSTVPLRETAQQFVASTENMLSLAQKDQWEDFLAAFEVREAQMATLMVEAGDTLLSKLPDLQQDFSQALEKNHQIEQLMRAKRDELAEALSSIQQQQRLTMTYR